MKRRRVILMPQAKRDLRATLHWLQVTRQSPSGAAAWLRKWNGVLESLAMSAETWGVAPEDPDHEIVVRQVTFRTRRGRVYRALFTIQSDQVLVLHIRGPGQDLVSPDDLVFP